MDEEFYDRMYNEGGRAYWDDSGFKNNPFVKGSDQSNAWEDGFWDALNEDNGLDALRELSDD